MITGYLWNITNKTVSLQNHQILPDKEKLIVHLLEEAFLKIDVVTRHQAEFLGCGKLNWLLSEFL